MTDKNRLMGIFGLLITLDWTVAWNSIDLFQWFIKPLLVGELNAACVPSKINNTAEIAIIISFRKKKKKE